jgi:hypothetical protein
MSDEGPDSEGLDILGGCIFWGLWLVLLFSRYWWIAVLIVGIPLAIAGAVSAWSAYKKSEEYRFRLAMRELKRLRGWASEKFHKS